MAKAKKDAVFSDSYRRSHALLIGINDYEIARPKLRGAINDIYSVQRALDPFGFRKPVMLEDREATKERILSEFYKFREKCNTEDRLFFFFAGHGCLIKGNLRDDGYLIPADGRADKPETLISWRELTDGANSIRAKHLFFVADACHSGLLFQTTRGNGGSPNQLGDAITRYARQALSSGQTYQKVDDHSGPRGNSIFTTYFIRGLDGEAVNGRAPLTASALGAYLIQNVRDHRGSRQRPQFGQLEGEGDFVFKTSYRKAPLKTSSLHPTKVEPLSTSLLSDDFFLEQKSLDIFLKDGHSFFLERIDMLERRFRNRSTKTRILILHPDFQDIQAVARMDATKRKRPALQRAECVKSVKILQEIMRSASSKGYDPRKSHLFRGYHAIPTWTGFIGDEVASVGMYFSRPRRGPLTKLTGFARTDGFYESIQQDFEEIFKTETAGRQRDLWHF